MKTQGEDGHLQAEERGLRRNRPCQRIDLRLLASRSLRKKTNFCCLSYPRSWILSAQCWFSIRLCSMNCFLLRCHQHITTHTLEEPQKCICVFTKRRLLKILPATFARRTLGKKFQTNLNTKTSCSSHDQLI